MRGTSDRPGGLLLRLRRDFRAYYLASLLCCLTALPAVGLVFCGAALGMFWLSLAGGAAGGLLAAQGACGLLDTILRSMRGTLDDWWPAYRAAWAQNARDALVPGAAGGGLLGAWSWVLLTLPQMQRVPNTVWLCMYFGGACVIGFFLLALAQVVLVALPLRSLLKHTEMLFLGFLPRTLAAALAVLAYWLLLYLFAPWSLLLLFLTGAWLPSLAALQILYPALDQAYGLSGRGEQVTDRR